MQQILICVNNVLLHRLVITYFSSESQDQIITCDYNDDT